MFLRLAIICLIYTCSTLSISAQTLEKKYLINKTYEYAELINAYKKLGEKYKNVVQMTWGMTDAGLPFELAIVQNRKDDKSDLRLDSTTLVMLVVNGIHAGESCGVDASLHWAEQLLKRKDLPDNLMIVIIPQYNIGGSLNRSCCTRANQNGPDNQGFRGNGQNLDLNRDFMKTDSDNAKSFQRLMQFFSPDIIVDTHSTNGADYQYTMTLIPYQFEKWPQPLQNMGKMWFEDMKSSLNKTVKTSNYVNVWGTTPDKGFSAFEVSSLFSGGYAGLFRSLNFTAEAHMFKTYIERVEATIFTLDAALESAIKFRVEIKKARKEALLTDLTMNKYATTWALDSTKKNVIQFEGFEAEYFTSELTGQPRYAYNRENPKTYSIDYFPSYKAVKYADVPSAYYLHRGSHKVVEILKNNDVKVSQLQRDTVIDVFVDYVSDIKYSSRPYEGHFPHRSYTLTKIPIKETFLAGDYVIIPRQRSIRYILEALEADCTGSFFRWNFFDTYLQQKEGFSSYIFEEKAIAFLKEYPDVKAEFDQLKKDNPAFAKNAYAQLDWVYKRTSFYEKEFMRIPVFRVF